MHCRLYGQIELTPDGLPVLRRKINAYLYKKRVDGDGVGCIIRRLVADKWRENVDAGLKNSAAWVLTEGKMAGYN